jgi:hypothetical protein
MRGDQMDATAAKQFLISRIIEQAEREQIPFSDAEKKMLYFSEVHPSIRDIYEVNAAFERDYDSDEYETKVTKLLTDARDQGSRTHPELEQIWDDALNALKSEDHYILVMAYRAFPHYRKLLVPAHHVRDYAIYITIGIALVGLCIGVAMSNH